VLLSTGRILYSSADSDYHPTSIRVQIEQGIPVRDLQCNTDGHVLVLRDSGNPACVTENTAERMSWKIISQPDKPFTDWCGTQSLCDESKIPSSSNSSSIMDLEKIPNSTNYWTPIPEENRKEFAKKLAKAAGDSLTGEITKSGSYVTEYGQISEGATYYQLDDLVVDSGEREKFTENYMDSMGFEYGDEDGYSQDHFSHVRYWYFHEYSDVTFTFDYDSNKITVDFSGWTNHPESIVFPLSEELALENARTLTMDLYSNGTCELQTYENHHIKKKIVGGIPFYDISLGACIGELMQGGLLACDVRVDINAMNLTDSSFGVHCWDG